ncbi:MAG: retropepsin-like aspartic protease [Gemmataceae bacterium]
MENDMGRVLTEATIENLEDLWDARKGLLEADRVRRIVVTDALVDSGATTLSLPTRYIKQLGLKKVRERSGVSSAGKTTVNVYDAVRLTIQGRDCPVEVAEVPDDVPVLIGQIPLEYLDFVVDMQGRRLVGNPAHGGEQVLEMY